MRDEELPGVLAVACCRTSASSSAGDDDGCGGGMLFVGLESAASKS